MNIDNLINNYETRKDKIVKWEKRNESQYIKRGKQVTILIGGILLAGIAVMTLLLNERPFWQLAAYGITALISVGCSIFLKRWLHRHLADEKKMIIDGDRKRLKALKSLLLKEGIDTNSADSIKSVISAARRRKEEVLPLKDIYRFIILPFIIIIIPMSIVFFDHLMQKGTIYSQAYFLLVLVALILMLSISCFMLVEPIRWMIYRKYDEILDLLELLVASQRI